MPGSSRAPNRLLVRRTPLPTTRTLPSPRVSRVTMRSASPSFWVRRTIPSSRYRGMHPLSQVAPQNPVSRADGAPSTSTTDRHDRGGKGDEDGDVDEQVAGPPLEDEREEDDPDDRDHEQGDPPAVRSGEQADTGDQQHHQPESLDEPGP